MTILLIILIINNSISYMTPKPREINLSLFVQFVLLIAIGTFVAIGTLVDIGTFGAMATFDAIETLVAI